MSASIGCSPDPAARRDQCMKTNPAITSTSIIVETRATRRTSMGRYGVRSRGTAGLSSSGSRFASWRRLISARPATFVRRGSSDSEATCTTGSGAGAGSCRGASAGAGPRRRGSREGAGTRGGGGAVPASSTRSGPACTADRSAAGTAATSGAVAPPAAGAVGRFRGGGVPRRLVRLANCGSAEQPHRGEGWAAPVYSKSAVRYRIDGAGSERRREGVSFKKEGNGVVPAPTACVGDACGATSCAQRQFNHTMWDSARGLSQFLRS